MMRRLFLLAVFALSVAASGPVVSVLSDLRGLRDDSFLQVCQWARAGANNVYGPSTDYERVEKEITYLDRDTKYAVVRWLSGDGRRDLHNLKVNDYEIGPERVGADLPLPVPTTPPPPPPPPPYRDIAIMLPSPNATPDASGIAVTQGFGAVNSQGTQISACVSFKNTLPKTATRVVIDYLMRGYGGVPLGELRLDRRGTFSTDAGIMVRRTTQYNFAGLANAAADENCVRQTADAAAMSMLKVQYLTYQVSLVEYSDGTMWANTTPQRAFTAPASVPTLPPMLPGSVPGTVVVHTGGSVDANFTTLPVAASGPDGSNIEFLSGYGSLDERGASIDICVNFRNTAPVAATVINVTYTIVGADGSNYGVIPFVRKGSFGTGVVIEGFKFPEQYLQYHSMNHNLYDNCAMHYTREAPFYNPAWHHVTYRVTSVEYADGTRWIAPPAP